MNQLQTKQVNMHKNFFDRCNFAIKNGFYIEAILLEYAAIESRLAAICGLLALPCGQKFHSRKDIKISSRIDCLRFFYLNNKVIAERTKLPSNFFTKKGVLKTWIRRRNVIVHGLYKDANEYKTRINEIRDLANEGLDYARLLYNEAKRINRIKKDHIEKFNKTIAKCKNAECIGNSEEKNK